MGTAQEIIATRLGCGFRAELVFALAPDELLDAAVSFVVGHLDGRMFGEKSGWRVQHSADTAIERELAATDRVDRDAGRVW